MDLAHFEKLEHKMADITFVDWKTKMWLTTTPFFERGSNYVFFLKNCKSLDFNLKNSTFLVPETDIMVPETDIMVPDTDVMGKRNYINSCVLLLVKRYIKKRDDSMAILKISR